MLRIGHRGACGYEPENTLRSFKKALELKVDMIELDVHLCESGELVVIHDEKVDRTTDGKGRVGNKNLSELKSLDAGKGETIPTLKEVLDLINKKIPINIELKGKGTAIPAANLIENYVNKNNWSYDDFLVSSHNHQELKIFYALCKKVKIGYLVKIFPSFYINSAKKLNAYSIHTHLLSLTKRLVSKAHKNSLKVFVFTINKQKDIHRLRSWGVDGIFSNYPDRI